MRFPIRCGVSSPHAVLFEWIVLAHAGRSVSQRPIELAFDLTIKTIQVEMRYDSVRMQRVERVKKTSRRRRKRRRWKTRRLHRFIFIFMHACIARARRESERMRRGFWAFFCVTYQLISNYYLKYARARVKNRRARATKQRKGGHLWRPSSVSRFSAVVVVGADHIKPSFSSRLMVAWWHMQLVQ